MVSCTTFRETEQENTCEFETRQKVHSKYLFIKRKAIKSHLIKVRGYIRKTERPAI